MLGYIHLFFFLCRGNRGDDIFGAKAQQVNHSKLLNLVAQRISSNEKLRNVGFALDLDKTRIETFQTNNPNDIMWSCISYALDMVGCI